MIRIAIFLLVFFQVQISLSQCNDPEPPGLNCQSAPLLCNLDGYCSTLPNNNSIPAPNGFCGFLENSHWVRFVALSETLVIQVSLSNCNGNSGMQGAIFSTPDCQNYNLESNCFNVGTGAQNFTLTANNLNLGEIYLILLDGKGGDVCDYEITLLEGNPELANAGEDVLVCPNQIASLDASESAEGFNIDYNWTTVDGNILDGVNSTNPTIDSAGTYILEVNENQADCSYFDTVEVFLSTPPIAQIEEPEILNCITNMMVTLDGSNSLIFPTVEISWQTFDGELLDSMSLTQTVLEADSFVLILEDLETGCFSSDTVTVIADLNTPFAQAGQGSELNCLISEITLDADGTSVGSNFSYQWTSQNGNILFGENGLNPTVNAAGIYEILVTNEQNGCTASDEVTITLNDLVPERAEIFIRQPCFGEFVGEFAVLSIESGNEPFSYSLDNADFVDNPNFSDIPIGIYDFTIRDAIGCEWDTTLNLSQLEEFQLELGDDQFICLGDSLMIPTQTNRKEEEIAQFIWSSHEFLSCDSCLNPISSLPYTLEYHLRLVDQNGCTASDEFKIFVNEQPKIFFPNAISPNDDGINDTFYVQSGGVVEQILDMQIFNRWGELVYHVKNTFPNDPTIGWDGKYRNEKMQTAVFTYSVKAQMIDGRILEYFGDFVLVR